MSQRKLMTTVLSAALALAATPLVSMGQAAQGQQPRGGGRGGDGQAAPRGDGQGRGGDARGGRGGDARGGQAGRGGAAQAQGQMIKQIKPGIYMVTGAGGNS